MIETELRDALHARAEGVPDGVADPVARVITAVGADRRRRTTRGAVSYTHLDVYKRQPRTSAAEAACCSSPTTRTRCVAGCGSR